MLGCGFRRARRCAMRAGVALSWLGWLPATAMAADQFPATSYFAKALHPGSSWSEIMNTPEIVAEFPAVAFGSTFVPLSRTCLEGGVLRPPDAPSGAAPRATADVSRWPVSVYRVVATVPVTHRAFLFTKTWEVSPCGRP